MMDFILRGLFIRVSSRSFVVEKIPSLIALPNDDFLFRDIGGSIGLNRSHSELIHFGFRTPAPIRPRAAASRK